MTIHELTRWTPHVFALLAVVMIIMLTQLLREGPLNLYKQSFLDKLVCIYKYSLVNKLYTCISLIKPDLAFGFLRNSEK